MKKYDATGVRFGFLTGLYEGEPSHRNDGAPIRRYVFRCDCGTEKLMSLQNVKSGVSRSCGCRMGKFEHGHAGRETPTYNTWQAMRARCHNPKHSAYSRYGAKGISVCDRWRGSFSAFLADMGERPEGSTLDRIDNSKGYEPGNCRWATSAQQYENKRVRRDSDGKFSTD